MMYDLSLIGRIFKGQLIIETTRELTWHKEESYLTHQHVPLQVQMVLDESLIVMFFLNQLLEIAYNVKSSMPSKDPIKKSIWNHCTFKHVI